MAPRYPYWVLEENGEFRPFSDKAAATAASLTMLSRVLDPLAT